MQTMNEKNVESFGYHEFFVSIATSGTSAAFSKTLVAPIERIKLLLQLQDAQKTIAVDRRYLGIRDCCVRVFHDQGLLSFWRGNWANVIRYFPTQALNFSLKEFYKDALGKMFDRRSDDKVRTVLIYNLASGGLAGVTSLSLLYPLEFARTRLAVDIGCGRFREFAGLADCVAKIFKVDGIFGLYRGFVVSVQCIFIYRSAYFGLFDTAKHFLTTYSGGRRMNFVETWATAQAVVIVSSFIAYPWDTVRRRMMMQSGRQDVLYHNSWHCVRKMLTTEGFQSLYKGAVSNVVRGIAGALVLTFYDEIMKRR